MTMKRTELEKRAGLKIALAQRQAGNRFRPASAPAEDRRARRDRDRALGRVPFAVKLPAPLAAALRARAQERGVALDDLVAELLQAALDGTGGSPATGADRP